MDDYFELAIQEYDQELGYDIVEIERCIDNLRDYLYDTLWYDDDSCSGLCDDEINDILDECFTMMNEYLVDIQSESIDEHVENSMLLIEKYRGCDQQRTDEWFERRRNMLTASIARAITRIDLQTGRGIGVLRDKIIPKQIPINTPSMPATPSTPSNPDAPTVRGVRYEPIIRQVYEYLNDAKVDEYDCVPHPAYSFIGASPDGIVVEGKTRGRMVEIKCPQPSSVVKDGNCVRPEYWCQMQLQMEVCNLNTCDYVRAVVRESPTLSGIQELIKTISAEYSANNEDDANILAAGTIWMDGNGEYHCTNPLDKTFQHEHSIYIGNTELVMFVRHFVIFQKDLFIELVHRDRKWFQNEFLPKARTAWEEIERGRNDPDAWQKQYPIKRRTRKDSITTILIKSPETCLIFD
jgi:putative phage-type endonuclease